MRTDTKQLINAFLAALLAVIFVAFCGVAMRAHADGPSAQDMKWLDATKKNQQIIATDRPAYDRVTNATANSYTFDAKDVDAYNAFVQAKADNAYKVDALNKDGWQVDWTTMTLVPFAQ